MNIIKKNKIIIIKKGFFRIRKNYIKNIRIILEKLNNKKKAIIIITPLSGSHHFQGVYKKNMKNIGWWNNIINNLNIKLNKICFSDLNSNFGSTNNNSLNPINLRKYKINFPLIKIKYIIKIKKNIINKILKIKKIYMIIGGSVGGLQNIVWSIFFPKNIKFFLLISTFKKISLKQKSYNIVVKNCLLNNYNFYFNKSYNYLIKNIKNLKLSRMIANITYLSKNDFKKKIFFFYSNKYCVKKKKYAIISKYLNNQGNKFIKYFEILNYLNIIKNINLFLKIKFKRNSYNEKFLIICFFNDFRFNIKSSIKILKSYIKNKKKVNFKIIKNYSGHDSFLIKNKIYINILNKVKYYRSDKIWTYAPLIPNQVR